MFPMKKALPRPFAICWQSEGSSMAIPITIPRLGWNMEEGIFLGWLKADGEPVRAGEMLFRLREIVDHQIDLADVLVRASMSGIELERPPIVLERELELPGVTIRVARRSKFGSEIFWYTMLAVRVNLEVGSRSL